MTELLGNLGLCLAMLAACVAILTALSSMLRATRILIGVSAIMLSVASAALVRALLQSDFAIEYVAHYTERALPVGYKLAAFWAGQEGSLLLWAWMLAVMAAVFVLVRRRETGRQANAELASLSAILLFFAALMLFAANPFKLGEMVPADGHGLNPMLQDPAMIAHPPLLFLGYAGYTFPFVMLVGALIAGRRDGNWLAPMRPWAVFSWLMLSIGILLGAQWAYVELGWGGYWAWDPVENASLLPWLTGTALLHSIMAQQHRGMFKKWNAFLIAVSFVLCIFGSYLTRSGVIQSVHAFGASPIGTFFLTFLILVTIFSGVLIFARRKVLKPEHDLDGLLGREGMFLATNVLLVGMTAITLIGTIFPIISRTLGGQEVTVAASFYNKVVAPMGLLLVALMAIGPLLTYGSAAAARLAKGLILPAIGAVLAVAAMIFGFGIRNPWALICGGITAVAAIAIVTDFARSLWYRIREKREFPPLALVRLLDANHRRYGGQTVHVGVLMIAIGIVGSSLFTQNDTLQFRPGESRTVHGRTITFIGLDEVRKANFTAIEAQVQITEPDGRTATVRPQRRFYDKSEQPNAEVSIQSTWREDVYVSLAGWENGGAITAIQIIVNPLVSFLWTGGLVLTIGGIVCLMPRLLRQPQVIEAAPAAVRADAAHGRRQRQQRHKAGVPVSA